MTVENFVLIVWTVFERIEKSRKKAVFGLIFAIFGLILAMFLTFQSYDLMPLSTQGPFGCRMTVQNFMKIVWTVFEKFEIFMKRLGEKKRHGSISSRKYFPTPNKIEGGLFVDKKILSAPKKK